MEWFIFEMTIVVIGVITAQSILIHSHLCEVKNILKSIIEQEKKEV